MDSKLRSKYCENVGYSNKQIHGSIDSIPPSQSNSKGPNNGEFVGQQCEVLKLIQTKPNPVGRKKLGPASGPHNLVSLSRI